jgi:hypothetical protein
MFPHPNSWRSILILSFYLCLPSVLFPSVPPTKTLYAPILSHIRVACSTIYFSPICVTCSVHYIFRYLIILIQSDLEILRCYLILTVELRNAVKVLSGEQTFGERQDPRTFGTWTTTSNHYIIICSEKQKTDKEMGYLISSCGDSDLRNATTRQESLGESPLKPLKWKRGETRGS